MFKTFATVAIGGTIAIVGYAQAAQADDGSLSQSLVAQAEAITADVEEQCQIPLREAAERATADPAALSDLEAANQRCAEIGAEYSFFVDIVKTHADAVTASIPEAAREAAETALAAVTPDVKAQVEAGDTESAVRTLFAAVAPDFDIEGMVGQ